MCFCLFRSRMILSSIWTKSKCVLICAESLFFVLSNEHALSLSLHLCNKNHKHSTSFHITHSITTSIDCKRHPLVGMFHRALPIIFETSELESEAISSRLFFFYSEKVLRLLLSLFPLLFSSSSFCPYSITENELCSMLRLEVSSFFYRTLICSSFFVSSLVFTVKLMLVVSFLFDLLLPSSPQ